MTTTTSTETADVKPRYFRNGKYVGDAHNQLGHIASMYTKGITNAPRINVAQLVKLLAKLGVTEPRTAGWMVTLPNGVTIEARAKGERTQFKMTKTNAPSKPHKAVAKKPADRNKTKRSAPAKKAPSSSARAKQGVTPNPKKRTARA